MHVTSELRWFGSGPVPGALRDAMERAVGPFPAPSTRTDHYAPPTDAATNVKLREGAAQLKRRDAPGTARWLSPSVQGHEETWRKWSFSLKAASPAPGRWIAVEKTRAQRHLGWDAGTLVEYPESAPPATGCTVELGAVRLAQASWWTVCLEAWGDEREEQLRRIGERVFSETEGRVELLTLGRSGGYAAWLLQHAAWTPTQPAPRDATPRTP